MKRRRSPAEQEAHKRDLRAAAKLLMGVYRMDEGDPEPVFYELSARTEPSEKEARAALARILLSGDVPQFLLRVLAALFDPELEPISALVGPNGFLVLEV
jgi:hypothetical protein